jgi:hypothetical protein
MCTSASGCATGRSGFSRFQPTQLAVSQAKLLPGLCSAPGSGLGTCLYSVGEQPRSPLKLPQRPVGRDGQGLAEAGIGGVIDQAAEGDEE